jgi:glyoxylase I family protein
MAIQHIGFNCRDRIAQEQFYTKHFGFARARVFNRGKEGEFVMLRKGETCIELFASSDASQSGGEQVVGFKHLAFEVDDLDEIVGELKADGMSVGDIVDCSKHVPGMRVCFFNDPDGNRIELVQGFKDE